MSDVIIGPPGGLGFRIEKLWAYLHVAGDGDEAVPAVNLGGTMMPLLGADEARVRALRPYAERVAKVSGKAVKFVCFERRVELETIEP